LLVVKLGYYERQALSSKELFYFDCCARGLRRTASTVSATVIYSAVCRSSSTSIVETWWRTKAALK